jgi:hypothetical protein
MNKDEVDTARTANLDEKKTAIHWDAIDWTVWDPYGSKGFGEWYRAPLRNDQILCQPWAKK